MKIQIRVPAELYTGIKELAGRHLIETYPWRHIGIILDEKMCLKVTVEELQRLREKINFSITIDDIERAIQTGRE